MEGALVQSLSVRTSTREPGGDGRLLEAENTFTSGRVQPFGECREHHCDRAREGVLSRYNGVWRRALNVVWQA